LLSAAFVFEVEAEHFGDGVANPIFGPAVLAIFTVTRHGPHPLHVLDGDRIEGVGVFPGRNRWRVFAVGAGHAHDLEPCCLDGRCDVGLAAIGTEIASAVVLLDARKTHMKISKNIKRAAQMAQMDADIERWHRVERLSAGTPSSATQKRPRLRRNCVYARFAYAKPEASAASDARKSSAPQSRLSLGCRRGAAALVLRQGQSEESGDGLRDACAVGVAVGGPMREKHT
jgi:hypothetical protein